MSASSLLRRVAARLKERPLAAALFAAAVAVRLALLPWRSLWFDEASTLVVAGAPWSRMRGLLGGWEGTPPLYFAAAHALLSLPLDPVWAIRLVSLVCGAWALLLFARFCRDLAPGAWSLAFFIGCFSSFWIHLSIDGRSYSLYLLLGLASSFFLWKFLKEPSRRRAAAYAAVCALGLLSHYYFAFLLAAHFLYGAAALRKDRSAFVLFCAAHAAALAPFACWLPSLRAQLARPGGSLLTVWLSWAKLGELAGGLAFDVSFLGLIAGRALRWAGWAVLAAAFAGALRGARGGRDRDAALFCAFHLLLPVLLVAAAERALGRPLTEARYFAALSPHLYVLLALAAGEGAGAAASAARMFLAACVLAGAAAYGASCLLIDPRLDRLAQRVRAQGDARRPVFHAGDYYYLPLRLYYLPERANFLLCPGRRAADWAGLPGGPLGLGPQRTRRFDGGVLIDPERRYSQRVLGRASGAELAELSCP